MAAVRHLEFKGSRNGFFEKFMVVPILVVNKLNIETIALKCFFENIAFLCARFRDRQTDEQMDSIIT